MFWQVLWSLLLGFIVSAMVQAYVPKDGLSKVLGRAGLRELGLATALGATDYVAKPVEWERFKHVMDRFRDADGDVLPIRGPARDKSKESLDGKGKASVIFSTEKGCFVSQKSTMEMKISIQGNEMPMKMIVELKLLPKK